MTGAAAAGHGGPGTLAHETAERRDAARALLRSPVLTAAEHPDELALVRRHATALKSSFATFLGYPLVVESSFARLVKAPLAPEAPTRAARRSSGSLFHPRTYTYLALVCAGLLALTPANRCCCPSSSSNYGRTRPAPASTSTTRSPNAATWSPPSTCSRPGASSSRPTAPWPRGASDTRKRC